MKNASASLTLVIVRTYSFYGHAVTGAGFGKTEEQIRALSPAPSDSANSSPEPMQLRLLSRMAGALRSLSSRRVDPQKALAMCVLWVACLEYATSQLVHHTAQWDEENANAVLADEADFRDKMAARAEMEKAFAKDCTAQTFSTYFTQPNVEKLRHRLRDDGLDKLLETIFDDLSGDKL